MEIRDAAGDWLPAACTLPTAERPVRLAEFDEFFRTAVRRATRTRTTTLDLVISSERAAAARDLAEREASCCAFFRFDFEPTADGLVMRIGVPQDHTDVLDAVHARCLR
jgi:hypothetical protein